MHRTHKEESLHLVFSFNGLHVDVEDRYVASRVDSTVGLYGTEDPPAVLPVELIAGEAVRDEE